MAEPESSELLLEKVKFKQIVFGLLFIVLGYLSSFLPAEKAREMLLGDIGIKKCAGNITIAYPQNKQDVTGEAIDVTGSVKPIGDCKYVSLTVRTVDGYRYTLTTDRITINPDGTWEARADLRHVLPGTRARIQAHLCVSPELYPFGCVKDSAPKGVAHSNEVTVLRTLEK